MNQTRFYYNTFSSLPNWFSLETIVEVKESAFDESMFCSDWEITVLLSVDITRFSFFCTKLEYLLSLICWLVWVGTIISSPVWQDFFTSIVFQIYQIKQYIMFFEDREFKIKNLIREKNNDWGSMIPFDSATFWRKQYVMV